MEWLKCFCVEMTKWLCTPIYFLSITLISKFSTYLNIPKFVKIHSISLQFIWKHDSIRSLVWIKRNMTGQKLFFVKYRAEFFNQISYYIYFFINKLNWYHVMLFACGIDWSYFDNLTNCIFSQFAKIHVMSYCISVKGILILIFVYSLTRNIILLI